jgi:hypothetical protein
VTIINHTFKFIFVHIPKCGGTSVAHALEPLCSYRDLQLGGTPFGELVHRAYGPKYGIAKHSFAIELRRAVGLDVWNEYTTFATVRDPLERTMSTYRYLKQHESHYKFMQNIDSFEAFLDSEEWQKPGPDRMFEPQFRWLHAEREPKEPLVDCTITLNRASDELPALLADIGVPQAKLQRFELPQKNVSASPRLPPPRSSLTDKIKDRYVLDFEQIFG